MLRTQRLHTRDHRASGSNRNARISAATCGRPARAKHDAASVAETPAPQCTQGYEGVAGRSIDTNFMTEGRAHCALA